MRITRAMVDEMVSHAQAEDPDECCGIVSGRDGSAVRVYQMSSREPSPFHFEIEPNEVFKVTMEIEDSGLDLAAIYHSHTRSEPKPSLTDIRFAESWPGVKWIIVGLAGAEPDVRIFEIRDGEVSESTLEVD